MQRLWQAHRLRASLGDGAADAALGALFEPAL
jgi:hypothetical protein